MKQENIILIHDCRARVLRGEEITAQEWHDEIMPSLRDTRRNAAQKAAENKEGKKKNAEISKEDWEGRDLLEGLA